MAKRKNKVNGQTALNAFISKIMKAEGGKSQANVGDVRQTLKIANEALGGALYKIIEVWATKPEEGENA